MAVSALQGAWSPFGVAQITHGWVK